MDMEGRTEIGGQRVAPLTGAAAALTQEGLRSTSSGVLIEKA